MSYIDDKGQIHRHGDEPISYDTDIVRTYLQRGMNYHRMHQYQYAIDDYTTYINVNPGDSDAYFLRGQAFCTLEQYQSALEDFDRTLHLSPMNVEVLFHRALAHERLCMYHEAINDSTLAIRYGRDDSSVYAIRGYYYLKTDAYEQSISDLHQALERDGNNEIAKLNLQDAYCLLALTYVKKGNDIQAIEAFDLAIQHGRNDSWVFHIRGICFLKMENYPKAIEDFKKALYIDPENEDTQALLESAEASNAQTRTESFTEMHEESYKRFAEGEVVVGKIISVDKDYVLVDIGYKSEGQIANHEFRDKNGDIHIQEGDTVEAMVEWWNDENEVVVLSREKAVKIKVWEAVKKAYEKNETVKGVIVA